MLADVAATVARKCLRVDEFMGLVPYRPIIIAAREYSVYLRRRFGRVNLDRIPVQIVSSKGVIMKRM
jgi:hypothetical protein